MSQYDFGNIDPATKSGDQLATDLNNWRDALNSLHKGATRPTYAQAGTVWIDDHVSPWTVKLFSGSADVAIGTVDPTSGAFVAANSDKVDGKDASAFATAADGALARSAVQPDDLGEAAEANIGTTSGTVAAGDDSRIVNAAKKDGSNATGTWGVDISGNAATATKVVAFESTEQAITSAGSLTIAHGLGVVPREVEFDLVCTTAEKGYQAGEILDFGSSFARGNQTAGVTIVKDAVELHLYFGAYPSVFSVMDKTTGGAVTLTNANWKMIVRAYL